MTENNLNKASENPKSILDLILSLRESRELGKPVPYSYTLGQGEQKIFVVGMAHFKSPDDSQFTLMKERWQEFESTPGEKVVFVENYIPPVDDSFEHAIEHHGEIGAAAWLARSRNYELVMADLSAKEITQGLSEKFGIDETAYHFIVYTLWNAQRSGREATLDKVIDGIRGFIKPFGLDIDRAWFDVLQQKLFPGQEFDESFMKSKGLNAHMGKIMTESAHIRNIRAVELFQEYWKKGYSIYSAYGANHSWEWEPALRELVGEN